MDILVGKATIPDKCSKRCKWGKWGKWGLVRLWNSGKCSDSVDSGLINHLVIIHSLPNKTDKLFLLTRTNKGFLNSTALCFTETWM